MKLIDGGTVFAGRAKTDGSSAAFPNVCVLETGRWLVAYRLAPAKSSRTCRSYLSWSDDQGRTWSSPSEFATPIKLDGKQGCWRTASCTALGGQSVVAILSWEDCEEPLEPMYNEATDGIKNMRPFTALSDDGGQSFSEPAPVDCRPYNDIPLALTGPVNVLPDGRWAVPFELNKTYDDTSPWRHALVLGYSSDRGKTWGKTAEVAGDPDGRLYYWDGRLRVLGDDSVLAFFWTFDRKPASYLNIHARRSKDSTRTWGEIWDTGVPGQPARPVWLPDGRVCQVRVDRTADPKIKARLSTDGGKTFPKATDITIHERDVGSQIKQKHAMQDAWDEMMQYSIGLPDAVALASGDVLVVFYSGDHYDRTDIRWARLSP